MNHDEQFRLIRCALAHIAEQNDLILASLIPVGEVAEQVKRLKETTDSLKAAVAAEGQT